MGSLPCHATSCPFPLPSASASASQSHGQSDPGLLGLPGWVVVKASSW